MKNVFIFIVRFIKVYCIVTQSIQNYDNRRQGYGVPQQNRQGNPNMRAPMPQSVRIPDYYEQDNKQTFIDTLKESPVYTMGIRAFFGPLIDHPIASILTWFGCGFLLNKYDAACGGEYDKSLLKKVTNFGDKIENSKFVQSKPVQTFLGWFKKGGAKSNKLIEKNSVLSAMKNTPSMPELELVKSEMLSQRQRVVHDFNHIVNELKLSNPNDFAKLHKLGLDKKERQLLKDVFKVTSISDIPEEKASSFIQLKRLGKADAEIMKIVSMADGGVSATKQAVLKALGHDVDWLKKVQKDTIGNYIDEVQSATKKVGGKVKIGLGKYSPFGINLGWLTRPGERTLGCDSVANRLISLDPTIKDGAKTATGRFMSRFMQMVHRGLTFGGGKYGVLLFIAPALVETAINVYKAEPNEKVGTGVSNLTNHISWVFTFPFALQIMHHICGAQYAGMSKEKVQELRKLQTDFNDKNKLKGTPDEANGFKNQQEYEAERKVVNKKMKALKKVEGQKWYVKGIRKLANFITPDLGKLDAYNPGNMFGHTFFKMRNFPRNFVGVPLRLIAFFGLTMGVMDTILNKSIKFVFGNSYDSMKEEEIKDAKKEQKKFLKEDLNDRLYEAQKQKLVQMAIAKQNRAKAQAANNNPQAQGIAHKGTDENSALIPTIQQNDEKNKSETLHKNSNIPEQFNEQSTSTPILKQDNTATNSKILDNYSYIPNQTNILKPLQTQRKLDTYSYLPSQDSKIQIEKSKMRTYIPSQEGAKITKSFDNSRLQAAIDKAQRAENRAIKILKGDFEGM